MLVICLPLGPSQEMIARTCLSSPQATISASELLLNRLALRVLDYEKELDGKVFERFNQDFFALRLGLENHFGPQLTSLSDLYKGAWVGEEAGSIGVMLACGSVGTTSRLVKRFPSSRQDLELGTVYRNAAGAPYDLVCRLQLAEGGRVTVAYECRHVARLPSQGKKIGLGELTTAMAKTQGAGGGDEELVLVFISNRVVDGSVVEQLAAALGVGGSLSHAIIVARDNCIDYFGPSLARRFMGYEEPRL